MASSLAMDEESPSPVRPSQRAARQLTDDGSYVPVLTAALQTGYNVGADFSIAIGGFGLDTTPTPRDFFDLDNLSKYVRYISLTRLVADDFLL